MESKQMREQDADLVLKKLKLKRLGQPHDDVLLTADKRFKHYKANEDRIILKDGLLLRKYYGDTGSVKYYQILIPKQLVNEVLRSLHGEFGKHPGITKMIIAYREKYYYPKMAQMIREWVMSCEKCIRELRVNPQLTPPPPLQNPNEHITAPEDAMQIGLVPVLPPSGGYENIVTAMDVFSRYLFAYPTANQDATTIAKVLINIMTKHAYLPTTLISDKGTAFTSHVIKEVAGVLGITLKHATTKHAQTIGLLERSHMSIKQSLKIETGERRSMWHKYISIAVLNYNTSYHSSIGCEPSRVFHGRIPYNILDLKMGIRPHKISPPDSEIAQDVLEQTEAIFQDVGRNSMQAYIKYKAYYDKKANASKLKQSDYVYIYSQTPIIREVKFPLQTFGGLAHILLRKYYAIIIMWYAKLAPTRRKSCTEWGCVNSHPVSQNPTYQSHHANGNQTRKSPLNMMIYTPEHGSVNTTSQYLTATAIIWYYPTYLKSQSDRGKQKMKWGVLQESHKKTPQIFSPTQMKETTEPIRITTCSLIRTIA